MKRLTVAGSAIALATGWHLAQAQPPGGGFAPPTFDALNTETDETPDHLTPAEVQAYFQQMFASFGGGPGGPPPGGGGPPGNGGPPPGGGGPPGGGFNPFANWDADEDGLVSREEFDSRPRFGGGPGGPGGPPPGGAGGAQ